MQTPRYESPDPPGVVGTYGDRAIKWAKRRLGIVAGPWQAYVIRKMLRYDKSGDLVHRVALISTARQNGKSIVVRIIIGWLLDEGRELGPFRQWTTMLAAAHDVPQARIIYEAVFGDLIRLPELVEGTKGDRLSRAVKITDQRGIRVGLLNFNTVTSQPGSVRGKSAGLVAWDEMLTQRDWDMWQALAPSQSAQRSPLMLLTSTAGTMESVVLRSWFEQLVRQSTGEDKPDPTFYGAWWQSLDPDAGLDWDELGRANPALSDGRLSRSFVEMEHRTMPPELWRQERMNHWLDTLSIGAFGAGQWENARTPEPVPERADIYHLGVSVGPDWERATITLSAQREDGRVGTGVYRDLRAAPGDALTAKDIIDAVHAFPGYAASVSFEASSAGAPAFRRDRDETGWQWTELRPSDVVAACMDTVELVQAGMLAVDDPLLDAQVALAGRKPVGVEGAFRFARSVSTGPIDALLAATFSTYAARFASDVGIYIPA